MYNLLQECSEEKGWQKPTIETIQGNFRTLEYIIWLENKLSHFQRLAGAAGEYIAFLENWFQIPKDDKSIEYRNDYNSILKEREAHHE